MKKKNSKIISMLLIMALLFHSSTLVKATDHIEFAMYESYEFYGRSAPELFPLDMATDAISLVAYCEDNQSDDLICYIQAKDDSGFELIIPFKADGIVHTFPYNIPPVEVKIFFTGSANIRKTNAFLFCSVIL